MVEKPSTIFRQDPESAEIAFTWLLKLRWGAVLCQLVLIAVVTLIYDIFIPAPLILIIIAFQGAGNFFFQFRRSVGRPVRPGLLAFIMAWDVLHLTLLLYFTGGPMNPFTFLYLVHVALGALIMSQLWAWGLALLTVFGYALLFFLPSSVHGSGLVAGQSIPYCDFTGVDLHLQGMWVAYSITASFIVFFLGRLRAALGEQQQTLLHLAEEKRRSEKMASLATLAAGAAHEFSTPLSTIAVAAAEMEDLLRELDGSEEILADAALIRAEVRKCRDILRQLSADAGEHLGENFVEIPLSSLLYQLIHSFSEETGHRVCLETITDDPVLYIPLQTWIRTLKGLLKNGAEADPDGEIACRVAREDDRLEIIISDQGRGMAAEVLERAGEPFFTTKGPGQGLGLGLFLARTLAERFGGRLRIDSRPGFGTSVIFETSILKITGLRQI
jgi:two-component system, sensor histidine kinase RegB